MNVSISKTMNPNYYNYYNHYIIVKNNYPNYRLGNEVFVFTEILIPEFFKKIFRERIFI